MRCTCCATRCKSNPAEQPAKLPPHPVFQWESGLSSGSGRVPLAALAPSQPRYVFHRRRYVAPRAHSEAPSLPQRATRLPSPARAPGSDSGPASHSSTAHAVTQAPEVVLRDCAICLGTGGSSVAMLLSCGHAFCRDCIAQHMSTQARSGLFARCPHCDREVLEGEARACLPGDVVDRLLRLKSERSSTSGAWRQGLQAENREARLAFEAAARRSHMKLCPLCEAPILKEGGCDLMHCRCGHRFNWSDATTIVACHEVHEHPSCPLWGATCNSASWIAHAKLFARRIAVCSIGAFVLPLTLSLGIVILVVVVSGFVVGCIIKGGAGAVWSSLFGCKISRP